MGTFGSVCQILTFIEQCDMPVYVKHIISICINGEKCFLQNLCSEISKLSDGNPGKYQWERNLHDSKTSLKRGVLWHFLWSKRQKKEKKERKVKSNLSPPTLSSMVNKFCYTQNGIKPFPPFITLIGLLLVICGFNNGDS